MNKMKKKVLMMTMAAATLSAVAFWQLRAPETTEN